jgi:hypothetical protein
VKVVGYSYPWDYLDDPQAPARARDAGFNVVALAASYHASRVASPLHPTRRVLDVPHSAIYVPVREEVWRGHRLIPRQPTWTEQADLFGVAQRQLSDVGLDVDAWMVLTHNDDLGWANPGLVVRNAFGDAYPYALCPSSPDVREYCLTMVDEVLRMTSCRGVVLEAWGSMGVEHASQHGKTDFAGWGETSQQLLSLCFCDECRRAFVDAGIDVDDLTQRVRTGVDAGAAIEDALGEDLATAVLSLRQGAATQLRETLVQRIREVRSDANITLHASSSGWATGSFSAYGTDATSAVVDTVVANCWKMSTGGNEIASLRGLVKENCAVGAYLRLDQNWSNQDELTQCIERYARAGMTELHLYHLGLVSSSGIDAATRIVRAGSARDQDA